MDLSSRSERGQVGINGDDGRRPEDLEQHLRIEGRLSIRRGSPVKCRGAARLRGQLGAGNVDPAMKGFGLGDELVV